MNHVETSFQNPKVFSIKDDDFVVMVGWTNPNDGNGTHAAKGTIFLERTCGQQAAVFWWKYNDTDPKAWITWGTGQPRYVKTFGYDGTAVAPKWLEVFHSIASDTTPFRLPEDGTLRAVSVRVDGTSTVSFKLYKNGSTLLDTLTLTAQNANSKKGLSIALVTGDELSVKVASGSAKDIAYDVFIQVNYVP